MKTLEVLRKEEARLAAALKAVQLTIALLEDEDPQPRAAGVPLLEPSREEGANRGGSKKARKKSRRKGGTPGARGPNGTDCDLAAEGGCSTDFYAVKPCRKCGAVFQRCSNHGGMSAAIGRSRSHSWDHRKGNVDEHGARVDAGEDDGTVGAGTADHPGRLRGSSAALSVGEL